MPLAIFYELTLAVIFVLPYSKLALWFQSLISIYSSSINFSIYDVIHKWFSGAGHMVPTDMPIPAYEMFQAFLDGKL